MNSHQYPVVVIDDEIWMRRILCKILEGFGFTPYPAENGFEGLALVIEHKPVLVILDVIMPELSGHLTLRLLKAIKTTRDIPVVMVTAVSDKENLGLAFKAGAEGFIRKPFTRATIFEKLRDVLGPDLLNSASLQMHLAGDAGSVQARSKVQVQDDYSAAIASGLDEHPFVNHTHSQETVKRYAEDGKRNLDAVKELLLIGKK